MSELNKCLRPEREAVLLGTTLQRNKLAEVDMDHVSESGRDGKGIGRAPETRE